MLGYFESLFKFVKVSWLKGMSPKVAVEVSVCPTVEGAVIQLQMVS